MKDKIKFLKNVIKFSIIPFVFLVSYLSYQFIYLNSQAKDIKSIQNFSKISKTARLLNDKKTMQLIHDARADDKITRKEMELIKRSSIEFKREVAKEIKPAEQREKEFMERRAKFLKEFQNTENNE
jgi:hypothetical protein